jgi:hypothetical protein
MAFPRLTEKGSIKSCGTLEVGAGGHCGGRKDRCRASEGAFQGAIKHMNPYG